jgi:hypothetical protein
MIISGALCCGLGLGGVLRHDARARHVRCLLPPPWDAFRLSRHGDDYEVLLEAVRILMMIAADARIRTLRCEARNARGAPPVCCPASLPRLAMA